MPGSRRPKTFLEEVAAADEVAPIDFDPEEIRDLSGSESSGSDSAAHDQDHAREHYVDVEKSKLRKRDVAPLGPQYRGVRIGREALEDEDSDDPFSRRLDEEGDSEEERSGTEDEQDTNLASASSHLINGNGGIDEDEGESTSQEHYDSDVSDNEEDEDGSISDMEEEEDDDNDDEDMGEADGDRADDRAELRRMMKEDAKGVTASLAKSIQADVEKGEAVKAQRKTFDALLNTRIRLQKSLISANTLSIRGRNEEDGSLEEAQKTLRSAEQAALNLLNNLASLRASLDSARTGSKRKHREDHTTSDPSEAIWASLRSQETGALPHRQATLNKWSEKSRPTPAATPSQRLLGAPAPQQTLTSVLQSQLADPARLVARTQTPRSCAPATVAAPTPAIYDDADFYGLLLKELLERRSAELGGGGGGGLGSVDAVQARSAARAGKVKKAVDTRASKGRKLRYTVHEKLQNFMAPEDRGTWGERRADELFGSLFGRRMGLDEDADEEMDGGDDVESARGEEALKLFRG